MELCTLQAMLFQLLGQQVLSGDLQLFLVGIAGQLNDLHTVQQRARDRVQRIGSGDEHDAAEIHGNLQKVVTEGVVLLAVEDLQQCRSRVAPHVAGQLVDLIQHQQRVHGAGAGQRVDNTAGHGADIRLAVTADIRLVPHTAQRQAGQLAVHGLGHGDGNGGLSHTGRAYQTEDLSLGAGVDLLHGDKLQNPLLDLLKAKVVTVQNGAGFRHVGPVLGGLVPRDLQTYVQIVADHRRFRAAIGLLGQTIHFFHQLFVDFLGQLQLFDLFRILGDLLVAIVAQFVLQDLHLLPQDHVLLHLSDTGAYLVLQLHLQRNDLHLVGQQLIHKAQALHRVQFFQNTLAITVAQVDVLGDKVRQTAGIAAIQHRGNKIVAEIGDKLLVFAEDHIGLADQRFCAGGHPAGEILLQQLHIGLQEGAALPQAMDPGTLLALHNHTHTGFGSLDDLQNAADRAHGIEVLLRGRRGGDLTLGHQKDAAVALHGIVQRIDRDLTLYVKAQC